MKDKKRQENFNIMYNHKKMLEKSWTYEKLTKEEKETFEHIFSSDNLLNILKGTEKQKINILNMIYSSFLAGLGYNGFNWRETQEKPF